MQYAADAGLRFEVRCRAVVHGGSAAADTDGLRVDAADEVILLLAAATGYDGFENARAGRGGLPLRVEGSRNQSLWIEVYTPRDLPPGFYDGAVTVTADGRATRLPVELQVFDFTLPDTNSLDAMVTAIRPRSSITGATSIPRITVSRTAIGSSWSTRTTKPRWAPVAAASTAPISRARRGTTDPARAWATASCRARSTERLRPGTSAMRPGGSPIRG